MSQETLQISDDAVPKVPVIYRNGVVQEQGFINDIAFLSPYLNLPAEPPPWENPPPLRPWPPRNQHLAPVIAGVILLKEVFPCRGSSGWNISLSRWD